MVNILKGRSRKALSQFLFGSDHLHGLAKMISGHHIADISKMVSWVRNSPAGLLRCAKVHFFFASGHLPTQIITNPHKTHQTLLNRS